MTTPSKHHVLLRMQKLATALVVGGVCMSAPGQAAAYFSAQQTAKENTFTASSLGISVLVADESETTREMVITADAAEDIEYAAVKTDENGIFCADVMMSVSRNGVGVYSGPLADFSSTPVSALGAGDSDELTFAFSVANDNLSYGGDCTIELAYQANQAGYAHGQAFFDTEIDMFTLLGTDFGSPAPLGVVLNEVLPNPEGDDAQGGLQGEWIEIYNNGDTPVDLTGWYIKDAAGNQVNFTSANTLAGKMTVGVPGSTNEWVVLYMSGAILNNSGDTIYLYDDTNTLLDQYSYGTSTNINDPDSDSHNTPGGNNEGAAGAETAFNEGKSDARIPDGVGSWVDPEPTAGEPNIVSEPELRALGYSESMIALLLQKQAQAKAHYQQLERQFAAAAETQTDTTTGSKHFTFAPAAPDPAVDGATDTAVVTDDRDDREPVTDEIATEGEETTPADPAANAVPVEKKKIEPAEKPVVDPPTPPEKPAEPVLVEKPKEPEPIVPEPEPKEDEVANEPEVTPGDT